jgi:hypothetical protein
MTLSHQLFRETVPLSYFENILDFYGWKPARYNELPLIGNLGKLNANSDLFIFLRLCLMNIRVGAGASREGAVLRYCSGTFKIMRLRLHNSGRETHTDNSKCLLYLSAQHTLRMRRRSGRYKLGISHVSADKNKWKTKTKPDPPNVTHWIKLKFIFFKKQYSTVR